MCARGNRIEQERYPRVSVTSTRLHFENFNKCNNLSWDEFFFISFINVFNLHFQGVEFRKHSFSVFSKIRLFRFVRNFGIGAYSCSWIVKNLHSFHPKSKSCWRFPAAHTDGMWKIVLYLGTWSTNSYCLKVFLLFLDISLTCFIFLLFFSSTFEARNRSLSRQPHTMYGWSNVSCFIFVAKIIEIVCKKATCLYHINNLVIVFIIWLHSEVGSILGSIHTPRRLDHAYSGFNISYLQCVIACLKF